MRKKSEQHPHILEMIRKHTAELEKRAMAEFKRSLKDAAASVFSVNRHA
ncbi:hypothetical protein ACF6HX_002563 [Escherichia coli]|nr:hypothetical protein [Escherichia coli]HBA7687356.1 hypothetical protein [Escherichia coli]